MNGLNATPSAQRTHIGFFGRRNAGKSSLVNAVTGQNMSIVSDTLGTTTDPVSKAMELLPLGPVVIIDTPGFDDDDGALGAQRVERSHAVLAKTDIAVIVADVRNGLGEDERELIDYCDERSIPHLTVYTHCDLAPREAGTAHPERLPSGVLAPLYVSSVTGEGVQEVKNRLASLGAARVERPLVRDLLSRGDIVVLVTPIDEAAPKGRLILPQVQTLRDVLDAGAIGITVQVEELETVLHTLRTPPALVITDSQAFASVARLVPEDIPLTSFSILVARQKGVLKDAVRAVHALRDVKPGDRVLVAEGCTHDRTCNDIATVKIPRWIEAMSGGAVEIETSTGFDFPRDVSHVQAVLHCGGCMLNSQEMAHRRMVAHASDVPMTNFGLAIAFMHGILERSLNIFPELA